LNSGSTKRHETCGDVLRSGGSGAVTQPSSRIQFDQRDLSPEPAESGIRECCTIVHSYRQEAVPLSRAVQFLLTVSRFIDRNVMRA